MRARYVVAHRALERIGTLDAEIGVAGFEGGGPIVRTVREQLRLGRRACRTGQRQAQAQRIRGIEQQAGREAHGSKLSDACAASAAVPSMLTDSMRAPVCRCSRSESGASANMKAAMLFVVVGNR